MKLSEAGGGIGGGLFDGELAAGLPDYILRRAGFDELKPVAEGASLTDECVDLHIAGRHRSAHHLSPGLPNTARGYSA